MKREGARVAETTWIEVERRAREAATGVLGIGAAAKPHGAHLPMNTDYRQAEWLMDRLVEQANVLVWPTLVYGYYPAFIDYPGSCSLPSQIFQEVVKNVLENIYRAGPRSIVIVNTGISTMKPLQEAIDIFPESKKPSLANVYCGRRFNAAAKRVQEQAHGGHADELETSIMLAIAPEAVDMSLAQSWDAKELEPGAFSRSDPGHPNYSPQCVYGDPTRASAEKGQRLLEAMLADVLELL